MDKNKELFLKCLGDFLNCRETAPQKDIDWETIYDFALKHHMVNIIEYQCGKFMDEKARPYFEKAGKYAILWRMKIENIIEILADTCKSLGIEYAFLKGPCIAPFYAVPIFRTMGDVDLLVHSEDRPRVASAIIEKGFVNKSKNDEHEWVFSYDETVIELHDKLSYKEVFNNEKQDEFFNNVWGYVKDGKIDESFHFIYLLHHIKKHLTSYGVGFRQFLDIACMARNCESLNWDWIFERITALKMLDFSNLCFALCKRWFDTDMRGFGTDINDIFYAEATDKIFANGVFGLSDWDNRFNMSVNRVQAGKNRFFTYFLTVLRNVFPSYKNMSAMAQYSFLQNKPYLLPYAWVYRIFWGIKNGKKRGFYSSISSVFVPKDKLDKRMEDLKKWNLD